MQEQTGCFFCLILLSFILKMGTELAGYMHLGNITCRQLKNTLSFFLQSLSRGCLMCFVLFGLSRARCSLSVFGMCS